MRVAALLASLVSASCLLAAPAAAQNETEAETEAAPSARLSVIAHPLAAQGVSAALGEEGFAVRAVASAGALRVLCRGGEDAPAFVILDREPRDAERRMCAEAGVEALTATPLGHGGTALIVGRPDDAFALDRSHLYRALAAATPTSQEDCSPLPNDRLRWSDIDAALPDRFIAVIAPPLGGPARAGLDLLAMESAARDFACVDALRLTQRQAYRALAQTYRTGEGWIDGVGETPAMARLLEGAPGAIAAVALPYALGGDHPVLSVDGVRPTARTIGDGRYPLARPLTAVASQARLDADPAIAAALARLSCETAQTALREGGVLPDASLTPAPSCAEN